jgi:hypothetical protein
LLVQSERHRSGVRFLSLVSHTNYEITFL